MTFERIFYKITIGATIYGRRLALARGLLPSEYLRRVMPMVSYSDLFMFVDMLVSVITLIVLISSKTKK